MMKCTLTAAALAVVLASPALAQSTSPATPGATTTTASSASEPNFVQSQQSTDWRGTKLIGASVYGQDNASIGEIDDVLVASDGKIKAVVIGVGGFLGVGEKNVAVPFDKLAVSRKPASASIDKITVTYTKDELKNAPKFAYFDASNSATTGAATPDKNAPLAPSSSGTLKK